MFQADDMSCLEDVCGQGASSRFLKDGLVFAAMTAAFRRIATHKIGLYVLPHLML